MSAFGNYAFFESCRPLVNGCDASMCVVQCCAEWLGAGLVINRSLIRNFESRPPRCQVPPWAICLHVYASVAKQYNLVPAAGEVTSSLGESNGT